MESVCKGRNLAQIKVDGCRSSVVPTALLHIINQPNNPQTNAMSKKNTTTKAATAQVTEIPVVEQNEVAAAAEAPAAEATTEATETPAEAKKRERNYSQTAVDTADLERLNQLKTFVKEKLNVTISNQRIIAAALDCLGDNVEAFLKGIADEANAKTLAKERKAYEALKAKFEAMEEPKAEATEAPAAE